MKNTIFLVHKGAPKYLKTSINSILRSNSDCEIILIGDESNSKLSGVCHCHIKEVKDLAENFSKVYSHLSPNNYDYELFCICRWFYILEYMKENNIEKGYYQDSDVILNCDISSLFSENKYLYCFDSGHTSCFTYKQLESLCDFIVDMYINRFDELKEIYMMKKKNNQGEGISDMTLISLFAFDNETRVRDLSLRCNNSIFDHNLNCSDGYLTIYNKKIMFSINGDIMVKDSKVNKYVRLNSIHFQGDSKRYMENVFYYPDKIGMFYFDYYLGKWKEFVASNFKKSESHNALIMVKDIMYKIVKKIEVIKSFKNFK